ncbi:MFS transporter [Lentzea chajnantorensis]
MALRAADLARRPVPATAGHRTGLKRLGFLSPPPRVHTPRCRRRVAPAGARGGRTAATRTWVLVTTALTAVRTDLGASVTELEWTVNGYALSFAVLLLTAAAAGDRWGRRRVFVLGVAVFTAVSVVCAVAPDAGTVVDGRFARATKFEGAALVVAAGLPERIGPG